MTDTAAIRKANEDLWTGLLIVSDRDNLDIIHFNLALKTARTGEFHSYYENLKKFQFLESEQDLSNFYSTSEKFTVDGVDFYRFECSQVGAHSRSLNLFVAEVNNYYLVVKMNYSTKSFGQQFIEAIKAARIDSDGGGGVI